ncbi:MAG: hypothetical protein AAFX79_05555 [Planctomycetota bacterium]
MTRIGMLCVAAFAAATAAQDRPIDVLRGPDVDAPPTIVQRGMDGGLERVEGRPEIAAALALDLDEASRARVREVVAERSARMVTLLVDELDAVRAITDLIAAGESDAARLELAAIWDRFEAGRPHTPLLDELRAVLPGNRGVQLERVVSEYWQVLLAERLGPERAGDAELRERVRGQMAFELFQREIREAYDASLRRYRELLEGIYEAVEPTAEQRAEIRGIVLDHIERTRLRATPAERRGTMLEIYRALDGDQRERLYGMLLRQIVPD